MIVSDLAYLADVSEISNSLTGGMEYTLRYPSAFEQSNTAIVYQNARANSRALAFGGDAIAISSSTNDSDVLQANL